MKPVRIWPKNAVSELQDCFHYTEWDVFRDQELSTRQALDEYTAKVMDYINFCVDSVISWKLIHIFYFSHRSGDRGAYSTARRALRRGIKSAKFNYKRRIEAHFSTSRLPAGVGGNKGNIGL